MVLKYKKPDGTFGEWPAKLSGIGSLEYITQAGDLDMVGTWQVQAYLKMPDWEGHSTWDYLQVLQPLTSS